MIACLHSSVVSMFSLYLISELVPNDFVCNLIVTDQQQSGQLDATGTLVEKHRLTVFCEVVCMVV